ncbi:MAG: hypothetical protein ACYCS8_06670 [Acidithiobacillus sp.]
MWKKLAEKYRSDAAYRFAISVLADSYGNKLASAIKATAKSMALAEHVDTDIWSRLANKYRNDEGYRAVIDTQAARGLREAHAIKATALTV